MTDILKAIDAAYEKASTGTAFWAHWQDSEGFTGIVSEDTICQFGYLREEDHAHIPYDDAEANAQLITLLVNHYPELKAEIERLREALRPFAQINFQNRRLGAIGQRGDRELETVDIQLRFLRRARRTLKGDEDNG